ncbi:MAG: NUDIX domain-containing protein [bacterium]
MEKLYDASFGIIPIYKTENGDLKFLLVQSVKTEEWTFPKGHAEGEEKPEETARREVLEETGISDIEIVEGVKYLDTYEFERSGKITEKTVTLFVGFVKDIKVSVKEKEILDYEWATYEEALETISFEEPREILKKVVKDIQDR